MGDPTTTIPRSVARTMTGIQWTDFTGNAWSGCTRVKARPGARSGCDVCYAETFVANRMGRGWGVGEPRMAVSGFQARMRRLNRLALATGHPFSVFSLSLGDWLDPEVPPALRAVLTDTVQECGALTWLLLTHRPHLIRQHAPAAWVDALPANVWPGVTVDHALHGMRWGQLASVWGDTGRAWVSAEPLLSSLEGVDLSGAACVVIGGASDAPDASWELDPAWVDEAVARYGEGKVFFKQYGDYRDGVRVGKKAAGRDIHDRVYDNTPWPRHRELLEAASGVGAVGGVQP